MDNKKTYRITKLNDPDDSITVEADEVELNNGYVTFKLGGAIVAHKANVDFHVVKYEQ